MKYLFGIDCSTKSHSVLILNEKNEKIKFFQITNDFQGFIKLKKELSKYKDHKIGFELSHGPLIDFLRSCNETELYSINPLKIKRFKESHIVSQDKTDPIDAKAIALYLQSQGDNLSPMLFDSPQIERLKVLCITYDRIIKDQTRFTNRLRFILSQYFPLYVNLFSNTNCKILQDMILTYPTWEVLKNVSKEKLSKFLIRQNYRVKRNISRVLNKIKNYQQIVNPAEEFSLSLEAQYIAEELRIIKKTLLKIEKEFEIILKNHELAKIFKSLPGSGSILSAKLLSTFGDNKDRFSNANQIQSLIGTAPCNYQSGVYSRVKMRKACNKKARAILYQYAFSSMQHCKWARNYYDLQRNKGKTHSVAVRALSNIWVKRIFSMWKNKQTYNEEIFLKPQTNIQNTKIA